MDIQTLGAAVALAKKQGGSGGIPGTSAGFGTPTASATALTNNEQPTVKISASGPNTAKVFNFQFGIPVGADGKTPVKGLDYYTEADKQEIVDEVLENLPSSSGLPTITEQDSGKQLYARNSEWVVEEPPCGYMGEEVLFDKEVDTSSGTYVDEDPDTVFEIYEGAPYSVIINENEYQTVGKSFKGISYLGNGVLIAGSPEDTGEDYFITTSIENIFTFTNRTPGVYKLKILSKTLKKLDDAFIKNPIISGNEIGSQIFNDNLNIADGAYSHAEGKETIAAGAYSHAEGWQSKAISESSHAEGKETVASGNYSHAEGLGTVASGTYSHAEGLGTEALGFYSHAEGSNTTAFSDYSHVQGKYNIEDTEGKYAHIVGNGNYNDDPEKMRSNAHTLDWDGNTWYAGELYLGGTGQDDPEAWKASLPKYTASDEGKILKIVNGVPAWTVLPVYNGEVE